MPKPSELVEKDSAKLITYGKEAMSGSIQELELKPYMGPNDDAIIKTKEDFATPGAIAQIRLRGQLVGDGVTGNTDASSNRDQMTNLYMKIEADNFANSVRSDKEPITEATQANEFRKDAREELKQWATGRLNGIMFSRLSEAATNIVACSSAGVDRVYQANTTASIKAGDVLTVAAIRATISRNDRSQDGAGNPHPKIRPFKKQSVDVAGEKIFLPRYMLWVGPYGAEQLISDPEWVEQQKMAMDRGYSNNLFTGALGAVGETIIMKKPLRDDNQNIGGIITSHMGAYGEYTGDFSNYNGVSDHETEIALFMGATAGVMPMKTKGLGNTIEGFRYAEIGEDENEKLVCRISATIAFRKAKFSGTTAAAQKSIFHNKDYGMMALVYSKE